jgi:hypothetical protein
MFGSALGGYSRAAALDPAWEEPPEREKQLLEYLEKLTTLTENKVETVEPPPHTFTHIYIYINWTGHISLQSTSISSSCDLYRIYT